LQAQHKILDRLPDAEAVIAIGGRRVDDDEQIGGRFPHPPIIYVCLFVQLLRSKKNGQLEIANMRFAQRLKISSSNAKRRSSWLRSSITPLAAPQHYLQLLHHPTER